MKIKTLGTIGKTVRGFEIVRFKDRYGNECVLQQSSLADYTQPGISAIWLGVRDVEPKILATKAASVGIETTETTGWVSYPIPKEVLINSEMHLDRKQVAALIPMLQNWLDNGSFKSPVNGANAINLPA